MDELAEGPVELGLADGGAVAVYVDLVPELVGNAARGRDGRQVDTVDEPRQHGSLALSDSARRWIPEKPSLRTTVTLTVLPFACPWGRPVLGGSRRRGDASGLSAERRGISGHHAASSRWFEPQLSG